MKNKKILIIIICIILVAILAVAIILNINKGNDNTTNSNSNNSVNNIENITTVSEEELKNQEIEQKEKQYKENNNYQCFDDETFKIRFYYDTTKLQYGSSIAQAGKLALQEINSSNMFLYSTNEMENDYDKNEFIQKYIQNQVASGFTIVNNKDVTISKTTPVQARYVECQTGNVTMKTYVIFKENGVCNLTIGVTTGTESSAINEILDTIISE